MCQLCHFNNPVNVRSCLMCEAELVLHDMSNLVTNHHERVKPKKKMFRSSQSAERPPIAQWAQCLICQRDNHMEARFCDWCGSSMDRSLRKRAQKSGNGTQVDTTLMNGDFGRPGPVRRNMIECMVCSTSNPISSKYCTTCGKVLQSPKREVVDENKWVSNRVKSTKRPVSDCGSQTVGLFYPSGAAKKGMDDLHSVQQEVRARAPLITAYSPGSGFWRKQIDHIIAHLKVYIANNSDFRALFGQPRFGKVIFTLLKCFALDLRYSYFVSFCV